MQNMKEEALKSLEIMSKLLLRKHLAERLISIKTRDIIIDPFETMEWSEKKERSDKIITILETSKTEEEILQRVRML